MAQMFPDFQGIPYEAGIPLNTNNFIVGTTHIDRWKNPLPAVMTNIASGQQVACGNFRVVYQDDLLANGIGFNDATLGQMRKNTLCAVLTYLAGEIELGASLPILFVGESENDSLDFVVKASSFFDINAAASTLTEGILQEYIVSGTNPVAANTAHAYITVDFGTKQGFSVQSHHTQHAYHQIDLFSTLLYAMAKNLGIHTLIDANGHSRISGTAAGPFSGYDGNLYQANTALLNPATWAFQGNMASINDNISYQKTGNTQNMKVFSGATGLFEGLDGEEYPFYATYPLCFGGERRSFAPAEKEILCNLGYDMIGGACGNHYPIGNVDEMVYTPGQMMCFDILANDIDADGDLMVVDSIMVDSAAGTFTLNGGNLCFTPDSGYDGEAYFLYRVADDHGQIGDFVVGTFAAHPFGNCSQEGCNLVPNPSFENSISVFGLQTLLLTNPNRVHDIFFMKNQHKCWKRVECWCRTIGTPALHARNVTFTLAGITHTYLWDLPFSMGGLDTQFGDKMVGIGYGPSVPCSGTNGEWREGIQTHLLETLNPCKSYRLKFYAGSSIAGGADILVGFDDTSPAPLVHDGDGSNDCIGFLPNSNLDDALPLVHIAQTTGTNLVEYSIPYQPSISGIEFLVFETAGNNSIYWVSIDNVRLYEEPDITLTKTADNLYPPVGQVFNYEITVCNNTCAPYLNVVIQDVLAPGLEYAGVGTYNSFHYLLALSPGCTTYQIPVRVNSCLASIDNQAKLTGLGYVCPDPDWVKPVSNVLTIYPQYANLSIDQVITQAPDYLYDMMEATITVSNSGNAPATNIPVHVSIGCGTYQSFTTNPPNMGVTYNNGVFTIPNLGANSSVQILVNYVYTDATAACSLCAALDVTNLPDCSLDDNTNCDNLPPLDVNIALSKVADNAIVDINQPVTFTITATNTGTDDAGWVAIQELLPACLADAVINPNPNIIVFTNGVWIPVIAAGASVSFTVTGTLIGENTCQNCVQLFVGAGQVDTNPEDNYACDEVEPTSSDIALQKAVISGGGAVGPLTFGIAVFNGGYQTIHNVHLLDTWGTGCFTYTGFESTSDVTINTQYDPTNTAASMEITIAAIPPQSVAIIYLTYNQNVICKDCENCAAFVSFDGVETNPANNESCITIPNGLPTAPEEAFYVPNMGQGATYIMSSPVSPNHPFTGTGAQPFTIVVPEYTTVEINNHVNMIFCEVIMGAGSKIIVPQDDVLGLKVSDIHGCADMWAGIEVQGGGPIDVNTGLPTGGRLRTEVSSIADAAYAVNLLDEGANAFIQGTDFLKNYVGVYTPPPVNGLMQGLDPYLAFSGNNTFSCTTVMLPRYQGQPTSVSDAGGADRSYAYTGIELNNRSYDFMLLNSAASLHFHHLNNGFIASQSNIRMNGQLRFVNIKQYDPVYNHYDGAAVVAHGRKHSGYLTYQGNGATQLPNFIYCHYGLYAADMEYIHWHDANFLGVDVGAYLSTNKQVRIFDSHFTCSNFGVYMDWNAAAQISIYRNRITMMGVPNSPAQFGSSKIGIASSDVDLPTQVEIAHDTITMQGGLAGIFLVSAGKGFHIHNNLVNLQSSSNVAGIILQGTHDAQLNCNEVTGSYGNGYAFMKSNDLQISCNRANATPTGFSFWGTCANTKFEGNYMQSNPVCGLYLSPSALIGNQKNTGNLWLGTFLNEHARFDYDPTFGFPVGAGKFFVLPYSGALLPNVRIPSGQTWFDYGTVNMPLYLCANSNAYCNGIDTTIVGPGNGGGGQGFTSMDNDILEGSINPPQYGDEIQREAEAYLYEKVKDNPILQTQNVDVEEFYVDKSETNIGDFSEIKDGIKGLYASSQDSSINALQTNVKGLLLQIYANDSLLALATNANDSASIASANIPLQDSINVLQTQIQAISQSIQTEKYAEADSITVYNNAITTTREMEENEKIVNTMYLQTVAKGIYKLDTNQVELLQNIIYQCPLAGGSAVFKARSLYTLHTMQLWYNDDSLCNLVNMQWRHAQAISEVTKGLQVYPNPTIDKVIFDFETVTTNQSDLFIYNLQGQQILHIYIPAETDKISVDVSHFLTGMYLYKIVGNATFTGKLIIE